jgi:hypothetical protein
MNVQKCFIHGPIVKCRGCAEATSPDLESFDDIWHELAQFIFLTMFGVFAGHTAPPIRKPLSAGTH